MHRTNKRSLCDIRMIDIASMNPRYGHLHDVSRCPVVNLDIVIQARIATSLDDKVMIHPLKIHIIERQVFTS